MRGGQAGNKVEDRVAGWVRCVGVDKGEVGELARAGGSRESRGQVVGRRRAGGGGRGRWWGGGGREVWGGRGGGVGGEEGRCGWGGGQVLRCVGSCQPWVWSRAGSEVCMVMPALGVEDRETL